MIFLAIICVACMICLSMVMSSVIISKKTSTTRGIVIVFISLDIIFAVVYGLYFAYFQHNIDKLLGEDKDIIIAIFLIASCSAAVFTFIMFCIAILKEIVKFIRSKLPSAKKKSYKKLDVEVDLKDFDDSDDDKK